VIIDPSMGNAACFAVAFSFTPSQIHLSELSPTADLRLSLPCIPDRIILYRSKGYDNMKTMEHCRATVSSESNLLLDLHRDTPDWIILATLWLYCGHLLRNSTLNMRPITSRRSFTATAAKLCALENRATSSATEPPASSMIVSSSMMYWGGDTMPTWHVTPPNGERQPKSLLTSPNWLHEVATETFDSRKDY